ncbi:hypothetical protein [Hydrogenimonas sp.]
MRRWFVLWALLTGLMLHGGDCYTVAKELHALQNSIVERSYEALRPGAWALYKDLNGNRVRAVFVGRERREGQTLYGIEISMGRGAPVQMWVRLVDKPVAYESHRLIFKTLEPWELYVPFQGGAMRIGHEALAAYMRMLGPELSTILTPAEIVVPPRCDRVPKVEHVTHTLPSGKKVEATKITDSVNGAYVLVSPEVPFGMVTVDARDGARQEMTDFGHGGGKVQIDAAMRKQAMPMPVTPGFPGGAPMPRSLP